MLWKIELRLSILGACDVLFLFLEFQEFGIKKGTNKKRSSYYIHRVGHIKVIFWPVN